MIIGKFKQQDDSYTGSILSVGFGANFVMFAPVPAKTGNGPDFIVRAVTHEDGEFDLGVAWAKTSKKGNPYLSVKLDGPVLVEPINCALTKQSDGSHALVWNRKDDEQAAA